MYPTISEYLEAIKAAEDNFDQLKHLRPVLGDDGEPVMTSGNFAVVFKMKDEQTGKLHAVKCFLREQEGRAEAYRMIAEELEFVSSTFLTPIKYLDKELFVDTNASDDTEFPVLLMDWVEGETLDKYIRNHLDDQYELSLLAYQFSRLAMWLMPQPFAHGDLKPDNILVKSDGTLVLVDYDGMYVPVMKGQRARELGSPDFRHPSRTETDFDEHIDDFSLASILLSLKAISLQPSLLEEYGAQDRLLFSANDYRNLSESEALNALRPLMQDAELASLYSIFILAASQNNLSGVSFRLFSLNRPSVSSPKKSLRVLQIKKKIVNQSDHKIIKKELLESFQGKKNVTHIVANNGSESYFTQERSFSDETFVKGACKLNTVENDTKHVLFLFNDRDAEVGRYYIGKKLQGLTPKQLTEIKHELCFFESWNPETKTWVPCVGKTEESVNKQKLENEDLRTEVTDEDLANAWTDEYGVKYSADRKRLLGVYSTYLPDYEIPEGTKVICDDSLNGFWQEIEGLMISGKITIPSTVQHIGRNPFRGDYDTIICNSPYFVVEDGALYSVDKKRLIACFHKGFDFVVPDSVEEIGSFAFYACSIYCVKIPKSVSYIGDNPFVDAEINNVIIDSDSCYFYEENGALYRRNPQELVAYWGKPNLLFVDEKTTGIGPFAFWNGIERIGLPDSIRKISESAFYGYGAQPQQIYIPENSPIRFENLIIYKNKSGGEILRYLHDEDGVIYSKDGKRLLKAPKNIVEYNIKEDAIVIDDNAFSWCKELTKIIISSSIKKIGERAFWCCRSLEQMIIPDSVIEIGIEAFEGCESLKQIVIPNSITSIPNRAFSSCSSLLSISIPMSVTHIGEFAFDDCNSLETISLPESVSSIGKDAFQDCWNLMQISIPNSITKISEYTFLRCSSLIQVNIPESVQIIEDGAFMGCTKLQSISLPIGIKSIGDATFATCYNLDEMFIPEGVESIGANAFLNCVKLNKVWLSNKVTFIDPSAFTGCKKLEYIFIPDNTFVKFEKLLPEYREILMEKVEIDGHKGLKRFLSKKELEVVYKAKVVQGQYTKLICFYMNDGCQKYIPLCKQSQLSIGDEVDLNKAKLIELSGEGIYYGYMDGREYYDKNIVDA